jgi:hypothetical protein
MGFRFEASIKADDKWVIRECKDITFGEHLQNDFEDGSLGGKN